MKIKLICDYCGSTFEREARENKRSQKLNRKNFCSRKCCGKANIDKNLPIDKRSSYNISLHANNQKDEFTGFRDFLRRIKNRDKVVSISLEDLKEQWQLQNGICVYSGVNLVLPNYRRKNDKIYTASLDRIDSSKGYVRGNIQFISIAMNYLKNNMTHYEMLNIIQIIKSSQI